MPCRRRTLRIPFRQSCICLYPNIRPAYTHPRTQEHIYLLVDDEPPGEEDREDEEAVLEGTVGRQGEAPDQEDGGEPAEEAEAAEAEEVLDEIRSSSVIFPPLFVRCGRLPAATPGPARVFIGNGLHPGANARLIPARLPPGGWDPPIGPARHGYSARQHRPRAMRRRPTGKQRQTGKK